MSDEEIDPLTVEDLLEIAAGAIGEVAVRDAGLLAAAAGRPPLTVYGEDAYPTFDEKAAALLHSLVRNHALVDGNKRLAWAATRVFCILDGRDLAYTVDDAEQLMLAAAAGDPAVPQLARWITNHQHWALDPSSRHLRDLCADASDTHPTTHGRGEDLTHLADETPYGCPAESSSIRASLGHRATASSRTRPPEEACSPRAVPLRRR